MSDFQPPPTYAEVVLIDERTNKPKFNPIWLKWFLDLAGFISASGGGTGSVVHNDTSGLQGGTTNQFFHLTAAQFAGLATIASGNYTPTLTGVANVDASTAYSCPYMRVGSTVLVAGKVDVDPTAAAATPTSLGISLPIASNLGAADDLGGTAVTPSSVAGSISGDAANNRAQLDFLSSFTISTSFYFSFGYEVI